MMRSVFDKEFDKLDGNAPNNCKSCGVPFVKHLGLSGTCQQLIEARKRCEELAAALVERDAVIRGLQVIIERGK